MTEEFIWAQKHRPRTVADVILPDRIKKVFVEFVKLGSLPNLLLKGPAGVGKTTILLAVMDELNANYLFKNGSLNTDKDAFRTEIAQFASTKSFKGGRKYIIIDEADGLHRANVQPALRAFVEEYSNNCGFALTCNYPSRIMKELRDSRFEAVDFTLRKEEKAAMAMAMFKRMCQILETENVKFDKAAVAELVRKYRPDFRRIINALQSYAVSNGQIDAGILAVASSESIDALFDIMKAKDFDGLRQWVAQNIELEAHNIFRQLFDRLHKHLKPDTIPYIITIIADYQYKAALVVDQEINMLACLVSIMAEAEYKG